MNQETRGELERTVAQLWSEVFGLEGIGKSDNFFQLGGDSARAVQLVKRLNQRFAIELNVVSIFRFPTVSELASHLGGQHLESGRPTLSERNAREILI